MQPFEPNDYRKRVLAAVEARGGPQASDPFELYDIPLEDAHRLADAAVAERLAEVWAFWQRQRDHPKYRALVTSLVAAHDANTAALRDARSRAALADGVRAERDRRERTRYELFDTALSALLARHGGIPRDKLPGLADVGRDCGLDAAEVTARVRMHRVVEAAARERPATATADLVPEHRRREVRALLDELGRIWETPPPVTLLALLGCAPDAAEPEITTCAAAWRTRARELPSARLRTVVDELLVHVADLLESGPEMRAAYLDGVAADVTEKLRPRVRAAVLVEDRLTAEDHAHLVAEAENLGLDPDRGARVLAALAADLGVPVDVPPPGAAPRARPAAPSPRGAPSRPTGATRGWEAPLRAARAALRAGRAVEARRLAEEARRAALPERHPPVTAAVDEIEAVLDEARSRWRAVAGALPARRYAEVVEHLEHLGRVAADLPDPQGAIDASGVLGTARAAVAEADRLVAAAAAGPDSARAAALLAALAACPEHPGALAALAALPLRGPRAVAAERTPSGDVVVSWAPSPEPGVTYRVTRLDPDGSSRAVGRTGGTSVTDGGAPPGPRPPIYAVAALQAGRASEPVRSDAPPPADATAGLGAPRDVAVARTPDGTVVVSWVAPADGPPDLQYQVARRTPDGSWRVVGRTRATSLEDGGAAGTGPLPTYGVAARAGSAASERAVSGPAAAAAPAVPPAAAADEPEPGGLPTVRDLALDGSGRLVFTWPAGVTEVMVVLHGGTPPATPDEPGATAWKVTNARYAIDGGVALPPRTDDGPRHVAVASCTRADGRLLVAPGFAAGARLALPPPF